MIVGEELRVRLSHVVEPGVIGVVGTRIRILDTSGHVNVGRILERFFSALPPSATSQSRYAQKERKLT